ncbi:phage integrase SAM-like domain-containing protein [Chitinophaga sp. 22321]|uniref:Phage integrase SAM-like domain-containing protein n=1 Tax=Chitinophaga hostae TaxID=2831022 RepID=A0ABS5IXI7_9BACT|nr:phage integrase SAM-like domain-containing protein [Chitinophaga hostae]MBS0027678.1 phage integrase SAM-like domain-containing protein [Chitinophaga hostae]
MLLAIKPICPKSKVRRDGTSIIFIQYCSPDGKSMLLNTEIAIPPNYWNRKYLRISSELPEAYGSAETLNSRLVEQLRITEDIIGHAIKRNISDVRSFLKATFQPDFEVEILEERAAKDAASNPRVNLNIFFQIDDYIKCKEGKVAKSTLNIYKCMSEQLLAFQNYRRMPIGFQSLDFNFYEQFVDFLIYDFQQVRRKGVIKGLKIATIGKTIKQLRIFVRDRVRRKIISPIDLSDFKILDEQSDAIYLSWKEINQIFHTDLSDHSYLVPFRDSFVLGCLTGLRFSDFSNIRPEDIRDGMLYKKQGKSDHWVVIPLLSTAKEILVNRFKKAVPIVHNSDFNANIKEIGRLAGINDMVKFSYKKGNKDIEIIKPKYCWITSHTCRRSFCTNEFLAGTPVELIMKISGHKGLRDFYKYIRITPEEAGRKIREIWQQRNNLEGFEEVTLIKY